MSVYDNEKLYPNLQPTAPEEEPAQAYRLAKIDEKEKEMRAEIQYRDQLVKKNKRRLKATMISDASVITVSTALEIAGLSTLATGIAAPIGIGLGSAGVVLNLSMAVLHKVQNILSTKVMKHESIKTLAESKLDSISGLVSKAVDDAHISDKEYHTILSEVESYRTLKKEIRTKSKKEVQKITKEQREAILALGREQGKNDFLRKIENTSATRPANAI